jgi:transcription antitermination factor NusG
VLKVSDNPPIAWPEGKPLEDFQGQWWVAHTKSRNEKAFAHDLKSRDVNYFLPMTWKIRHVRGRKIKSLLPLFGGYLFFCGGESERLEALKTNRIASLIEVKDQQQLVMELSAIEKALRTGAQLQSHKSIQSGQRCIVTAGALKDIEGIVQQSQSGTRLLLKVNMLGQAASVEVDSDSIEIIE